MPEVATPSSTDVEAAPRPGRRRTALSRPRWLSPWVLLALVPLALVAVVFAYPVLEMFRRSFTDFMVPSESGFANYSWFFGNDTQLAILRRTFTSALLTTGWCLLLGFPYAYLMTIVGPRWRMVMLAVVLLPFWTSLIVRTYAWIVLLQDNGPVIDVLRWLGFDRVSLLGTTTAVVIGMTQVMLPMMVLPLYASLTRIDRGLVLAAQSLGARPAVAFARVYMPLAVPGILAGSTIVFTLALGFYFTPALLGSPQNSLLSQQIVEQVSKLLAFGRGGAMALVLLVITLSLLWISTRLARRYTDTLGDATGKGSA